jgi:hypothetical protein
MTATRLWGLATLLFVCLALPISAQQPVVTTMNAAVPPLLNFNGVLTDVNGKPLTGIVGVTFSLYQDQQGGSPLWLETQNIKPNSTGHYTVMLGSSTPQGVPARIFASGEAHWLGVQVQGQAEQPRVLLVSTPYALKALDAETVGGKPASAFMLAPSSQSSSAAPVTNSSAAAPSGISPVSGGGTKDYVPLWLSSSKLGNSKLFQTGGKVGIGTIAPGANLDVSGDVNVTSSYNLGGNAFAFGSFPNQNAFFGFAGNFTMLGTRNTVSGWSALRSNTIGSNNTVSGYQALFSNSAGSGNTAIGASALQANTSGENNVAIGGAALISNVIGSENTATGYQALQVNTTGSNNTASGISALQANTTGNSNTAIGSSALLSNTTGSQNTANGEAALHANTTGALNAASGSQALLSNTTGSQNTANGFNSLLSNTTGSFNVGLGFDAGQTVDSSKVTGSADTAVGSGSAFGTGSITNATALGANAVVSENNALVLGCIAGLNNCNSNVNVGIGTATPASTLDVHGTGNFTGPITFASGQTFPGTGTITGVTAGTGLTGGGNSGGVSLAIASKTCASGSALSALPFTCSPFATLGANNFTGNQTVSGNLGVTGAATIAGIGSFIASTGNAQLIVNSGGSGTTTTGAIAGNSSTTSGSGGLFLAASDAVFAGNNTGLMFVGPNSGQWEQGPSSTGGPTNFMSIAMNSTTTAAQNISFNTPTGVPVQTGRSGGSFTNTLDDGNNNMTVLGWIWQKGRTYLQSNPSNPTSTASTSFTMMGLGSTLKLTPNFSGTVIIKIDSEAKNTVDGNGIQFEIFYGTGTAPSNGSPMTGTQVGPTFEREFWGQNATVGFGTNLKITGLTVGTVYWFDIALRSLGSGSSNATIQNIEFHIEEI